MASRLQQLKEKWGSDKRKAEPEEQQSKRPKQLPVEQPVATTGLGLKAGIPLGRGRVAIRAIPTATATGTAIPNAIPNATPNAIPNAIPNVTSQQPTVVAEVRVAVEPKAVVAPKAVASKAIAPKSAPKAVVSSTPTRAFTPIPIVPPSQVTTPHALPEAPKAIPAMTTRKQAADQTLVSLSQTNVEMVREYEQWLRSNFGDESLHHSSKSVKPFSYAAFKEVAEYIEAVKEHHPDLLNK